ncbi:unnamed protein product [Plutella xylostella]|uniref:(diamondback moth) hypothetical protein n=1 Tax=Plutella xylostella TaxID=51655 RepID=Q6F438_PLUXY|nr:ejaculatory bulb-specific protein 3-like precursor [Plutella xylostella]BAD26696.1 sensory appendage protein 3-like protein [Plutella xylostella]CAG9123614.1 unnamed protein product [Plutella xylostella]
MKLFVALCFVSLVAYSSARPNGSYTDRYDNLDLDEILNNSRLRVPYVKCLLGKGKCSPDGKELKSHVREALENQCGKCTPAQQAGTRKVIGYLINNEAGYWQELVALYDPQRKYVKQYETELRKVSG